MYYHAIGIEAGKSRYKNYTLKHKDTATEYLTFCRMKQVAMKQVAMLRIFVNQFDDRHFRRG